MYGSFTFPHISFYVVLCSCSFIQALMKKLQLDIAKVIADFSLSHFFMGVYESWKVQEIALQKCLFKGV